MNKERKFSAIKKIIDAEIEGKIDLPNNSIIFTLTDKELASIMTKKRLELIRIINKRKPKTIKELADIVNRKLPAVDRDIKFLVKQEIIKTKRTKTGVQPMLNKVLIILPLMERFSFDNITSVQEEKSVEAQLYVEGKNMNQEMAVGD